jgi:hypothetical protein
LAYVSNSIAVLAMAFSLSGRHFNIRHVMTIATVVLESHCGRLGQENASLRVAAVAAAALQSQQQQQLQEQPAAVATADTTTAPADSPMGTAAGTDAMSTTTAAATAAAAAAATVAAEPVLELSEPNVALLMQHYGEAQQRAHELRQELLSLQAECAAAKGLLAAAEKSWSAERTALLQSRAEMGDQWDSDVQLLQG